MYYKQKNLSAIIATQSQSLTKNKDKKKFLWVKLNRFSGYSEETKLWSY
jgi:hypothetical protein